MHRRDFLRTTLHWTIGGWLGLNGLAAAGPATIARIALIIDDIGHPFPETAAAIHQFRAEIEGTGVEVSSLSSVLKPKRPAGPNQFRPIATRI
jgi:hypothetical protein